MKLHPCLNIISGSSPSPQPEDRERRARPLIPDIVPLFHPSLHPSLPCLSINRASEELSLLHRGRSFHCYNADHCRIQKPFIKDIFKMHRLFYNNTNTTLRLRIIKRSFTEVNVCVPLRLRSCVCARVCDGGVMVVMMRVMSCVMVCI